MFGSPLSRYNVAHVGCRKKEPFELDNWDVEDHCCGTYGISNMWTLFNSQTNVEQMRCRANGKLGNWNGVNSHSSFMKRPFHFNLFTSILLLLWGLLNIYVFVSTHFFCQWNYYYKNLQTMTMKFKKITIFTRVLYFHCTKNEVFH